jgi:DNA polymerase III delta prime subunit
MKRKHNDTIDVDNNDIGEMENFFIDDVDKYVRSYVVNNRRNGRRGGQQDQNINNNHTQPIPPIILFDNFNLLNAIGGAGGGQESDTVPIISPLIIIPTCKNPLCDHLDFTSEEIIANENKPEEIPEPIKNISDMINLGKTYHCKKRKEYFGLNLRIMFELVQPLTELQQMIGMTDVKINIVDQIIYFLQGLDNNERCNKCIDCTCGMPCINNNNKDMLHTMITGPPGVGKTELGKILGKVYKGMGILSKGTMHVATRTDLVGKYLGHTAAKTQDFINQCQGGVMFIDEAYSLGSTEARDSFSKECIDTLNSNLTEKRDFLCIIAGYADALEKCFFAQNDGLKRRFTFRYDIQGYSGDELMEIFLIKIKKDNWTLALDLEPNEQIKGEMMKELKALFNENILYFPHFGGDVETFFLNCKIVHGRRVLFMNSKKVLTLNDIKNGFKMFVKNRKYKNIRDEMSKQIRFSMYT